MLNSDPCIGKCANGINESLVEKSYSYTGVRRVCFSVIKRKWEEMYNAGA